MNNDWIWHVRDLVEEETNNEEPDSGKPLQLALLVELFDSGANFIPFAFLFGLANDAFHERVVTQRLVVCLALFIKSHKPTSQNA